MKLSKEYIPWLVCFVFINVLATLIMLNSHEYIGDLKGTKVTDSNVLIFSTFLIVLTYVFLMWPIFSVFFRVKIKAIKFSKDNQYIGTILGFCIFIIQILYFIFNSYYGVNTAGTNNTTVSTPLALLWVLIPPDALFIIYYAFYRENKFFKYNLFVWLLSNLLRGWAGVMLFVIFFEWCRLVRKGSLNIPKVIIMACAVLVLYPLLVIFKWVVRAAAGKEISADLIFDSINRNLSEQSYFELIQFGVEHIIGRLQLTSILAEIINMKDQLQVFFARGDFQPFWMEGLHGIFFERLFVGEKSRNLGVAFTEYANFDWLFVVGDWNINVSLPAWLFITPWLSLVYLCYLAFLCFSSVFLVKLIGITKQSRDLIWLSWFVYLIPLWLGTFVALIYAFVVFLAMKILISLIPRIKFSL